MRKSSEPRAKKTSATVRSGPPAQKVERMPLEPITGGLGLRPEASFDRINADEDLVAERVVLRQTGGDGIALADVLVSALAWDAGRKGGDGPLDLATSTLRRFADELETIHAALLSESPDTHRIANVAFSMARRAEMVEHLCNRIERAREETPARVAPPAPYQVACALLTLPGVLSAPTPWDRLMRIAERLDVHVATEENAREWMDKVLEVAKQHYSGRNEDPLGLSAEMFSYTRASETCQASIVVWPFEKDREAAFAERLARAAADREGYEFEGNTFWEWERNVAAFLLDRAPGKKDEQPKKAVA